MSTELFARGAAAIVMVGALSLAACGGGTRPGDPGRPGDASSGGGGGSSGSTGGGGAERWTLANGANAADLVEDVAFSHEVAVDLAAGTFTYTDPLTLDRRVGALPSSGSTAVVLRADPAAATVTFARDGHGLVIRASTPEGAFLRLALSGTYAGSITLESNRKLALALAGVTIASPDGPALNIQSTRRTFVILEDGTANTLSDSGDAGAAWSARTLADGTAMDLGATLFSEGPLVFSGGARGTGSLDVSAVRAHAVASDAHVRVRGGRLSLSASGRSTLDGKDGVHAREAFVLDGGTVTVTSRQGDGVQVEGEEGATPLGFVAVNGGTLTVRSHGHGVRTSFDPADTARVATAATTDDPDPFVAINGGTVDVTTTGAAADAIRAGSSLAIRGGTVTARTGSGTAKGLQCVSALVIDDGWITIDTSASRGEGMKSTLGSVTVSGGTLSITSGEDGIAAETALTIAGGSVYVRSGGGAADGLDSNGPLAITGGLLVVDGSRSSPGAALDAGSGITLAGGTFLAVGGAPSAGGRGAPGGAAGGEPATATVPAAMLTVSTSTWASQLSGRTLLVGTSPGAPLLAFELPAETTTGMTVYLRHPGLVAGTTYTLFAGSGEVTGAAFHGLYHDAPVPAPGTAWASVGRFTATGGLATIGP